MKREPGPELTVEHISLLEYLDKQVIAVQIE